MKIYRLGYHDRNLGKVLEWFPNHWDAAQRRKELKEDEENSEIEIDIDKIEFPTKKPELIKWLNFRFNTDNG